MMGHSMNVGKNEVWVYLLLMIGVAVGPICIFFALDVLREGYGLGWLLALHISPWVGGFIGMLLGLWKQMSDIRSGKMTERKRTVLARINVGLILAYMLWLILSIRWSAPSDDMDHTLFRWMWFGLLVLAVLIVYRYTIKTKPSKTSF
jgi:hypothetical protein